MTLFEIKKELSAMRDVESGYGVDYTYSNVLENTKDLDCLISDIVQADTRLSKERAVDRMIKAVTQAENYTAGEIYDSLQDLPEMLKSQAS